jgi:hypothetical protein
LIAEIAADIETLHCDPYSAAAANVAVSTVATAAPNSLFRISLPTAPAAAPRRPNFLPSRAAKPATGNLKFTFDVISAFRLISSQHGTVEQN